MQELTQVQSSFFPLLTVFMGHCLGLGNHFLSPCLCLAELSFVQEFGLGSTSEQVCSFSGCL